MSEDSQKFYELGEAHLRRDDPEEALQWYERAVQEDPQDHHAWGGRAKACYHLGQLERADRYFRRAIKVLEPQLRDRSPKRGYWSDERGREYLRLLHWRALCRFWMGLYEQAAKLFKKVLKLAPSDPLEVRFLLGETWFRMGELKRAARVFESAGDDPDAVYNLGLTYFYQADYVGSVGAFRRGFFENVYLACKLAGLGAPHDVPTFKGTHPRELDRPEAADEYVDRCGDLWLGRPLLQRWVEAIYLHPIVQEDLLRHVRQVHQLATAELSPGDMARIEGENTVLRSPERMAATNREIAETAMARVFTIQD
jgi:tetratricopeptide (TPR) repeat protein